MSDQNYWTHRLGRRAALRGVLLGSAGIAAAALVGCSGDDDSDERGASTPGAAGTVPPTVAAAGTAVASGDRQRGGTLRFAYHQDPGFLSPRMSRSGFDPAFLLANGDSYIYVKSDGAIDLDQSIFGEIEWATDQQLNVNLRDVQFHDGTPLDAEAVKAHLEFLMDEDRATEFGYASLLGTIGSIEVPEASRLVINLTQPDAGFLAGLAVAPGIPFSVAAVESAGDDEILNPVMTGPYIADSYTSGAGWSYVANENYWGPADGYPFLDRIDFSVITQSETRAAALESGDVHATWFPGADSNTLRLSQLDSIQSRSFESGPSLLTINQNKAPLDDLRLRQAIHMAIDKSKLLESEFQGQGGIAKNLLPTDTYGWLDYEPYTYNPGEARKLVEAAGGGPVPVSYVFGGSPPSPTVQLVASLYKEMLDAVGFDVSLENVPGGTPFEPLFDVGSHHLGAFSTGVRPDPVAQYALYVTGDAYYNAGRESQDPEQLAITDLVNQARAELDDDAREALLHDIGRKQLDNVFSQIPIIARIRWAFAQPDVVGFDDPEFLNTPAGACFRVRLLSLAQG